MEEEKSDSNINGLLIALFGIFYLIIYGNFQMSILGLTLSLGGVVASTGLISISTNPKLGRTLLILGYIISTFRWVVGDFIVLGIFIILGGLVGLLGPFFIKDNFKLLRNVTIIGFIISLICQLILIPLNFSSQIIMISIVFEILVYSSVLFLKIDKR